LVTEADFGVVVDVCPAQVVVTVLVLVEVGLARFAIAALLKVDETLVLEAEAEPFDVHFGVARVVV